VCDDDGIEYTIDDLRRTIDIAVMRDPERLRTAVRQALRQHLRMSTSEPIPEFEFALQTFLPRKKPPMAFFRRLNNEERAFAEFIDNDHPA